MTKILLSFVLSFLSLSTWAYDILVDGIYYNLNLDTSEAIVTFKSWEGGSYSGNVVIPETINYNYKTYPVVAIDALAFCNCSNLTSVTIASNVHTIGDGAFYG